LEHEYDTKRRPLHIFLGEFEQYTRIVATTLIAERHRPQAEKSIQPNQLLGGLAGGEKYLLNGVLFMFAVDDNGIYGADWLAAKAALDQGDRESFCGVIFGTYRDPVYKRERVRFDDSTRYRPRIGRAQRTASLLGAAQDARHRAGKESDFSAENVDPGQHRAIEARNATCWTVGM
jgi:hypothetical protein